MTLCHVIEEMNIMAAIRFRKQHSIILFIACSMILFQPAMSSFSTARACCPYAVELDVNAEVGSIHFSGEMAEFYILVSWLGRPIDAEINAILYYNGSSYADLDDFVEHVATGLYRLPYTIPIEALAGTYTLAVNATRCTCLRGATIKSFLLSQTLTHWDASITDIQGDLVTIKTDVGAIKLSLEAIETTLISIDGRIAIIETDLGIIKADIDILQLSLTNITDDITIISTVLGDIEGTIVSIQGDIAIIKTDIGVIQANISTINATLQSINGTLVTIQSSIGEIHINLNQINATLSALNGTVAIIQTDLGTIQTSLEDIQLNITKIVDDIATISTVLGDIEGTIVSIQDGIGTIETDLGEIKISLPPTQTTTLGIPTTLVFAVIAAIASTISAILLLRKIRSK